MLTKVIYHKTSDLYYTKFLSLQKGTLVVPGPEIADLWREELFKAELMLTTLTYADWIKSLTQNYGLEHQALVSKSELWDYLHRLWRNLGAINNFTLFQKVFEIYTELKSITADEEVFAKILEIETPLPKEIILGLSKFYAIKEINDEYQVIRNILEAIDENYHNQKESLPDIHLLGFKVLSALQLDLIQSLSKTCNVYIYLSSHLDKIVEENKLNDWVSWLKAERIEYLENTKFQSIKNQYCICTNSEFISLWPSFEGKNVTILMNSKELPVTNWGHQKYAYRYKTTSESGQAGSAYVLKSIQDMLMRENLTWEQVAQFVSEKFVKYLEDKADYSTLKWLQYVQNWCNEKLKYFDLQDNFTWLDYGVLKNKIELDAVRLFWQHYAEGENVVEISTLTLGVYFFPKKENILLINESMTFNTNHELFSTESYSLLKALAPTVSEEWHRWWMEALIFDYLGQSKNNSLVINQEALEFDIFIKNILIEHGYSEFHIQTFNEKNAYTKSMLINKTIKIPTQFSPSALLTYKNCPKQYYVNYIDKITVDEDLQVLLTESKKGEIYHRVLETIGTDIEKSKYFLNNEDAIISYLDSNTTFNLKSNATVKTEIAQILKQTLFFWVKMPIFSLDWRVTFEQEFNSAKYKMKGRIDFVAYNEKIKTLMIIDFKKSSVPTMAEIERYDHWQILCYYIGWKEMFPTTEIHQVILGYWNLSCVDDSLFFSNTESTMDLPITVSLFKNDWMNWENSFKDHWIDNITNLIGDHDFLPKPKLTKTCDYCILNTSCTKGNIG